MARQTVTVKPTKRWGTATHACCVKAIDPHDAYLQLYRKQYSVKPDRSDLQKDQDGNLVYSKHIDFSAKTKTALNPMISTILLDDRLWAHFYRYKHRNEYYLQSADTESFRTWYNRISTGHCLQIPEGHGYRNRLCLVPITDDQTYFIDEALMKTLEELVTIYFGLDVKRIDVTANGDNIIFKKNSFNHFNTADIHDKLRQYRLADPDLFAIVGICFKIGIFDGDNKVIHGEHDGASQTAVCSFGKIGIYNKLSKNTPQWLTIRRAGKVLLHEVGRLFGLGICEYFRCVMNKDVVLDCVPMTLCPVCLNKLYFSMILRNDQRDSFEDELPSTTWLEMKDQEEEEEEEEEGQYDRECCYKMDGSAGANGGCGACGGPRRYGVKGGHGGHGAAGTHGHPLGSEGAKPDRERTSGYAVHMQKAEWVGSRRAKGVRIDPNTFNLYHRYYKLARWFHDHQCYREATWYKNRCADLRKRLREWHSPPEQ